MEPFFQLGHFRLERLLVARGAKFFAYRGESPQEIFSSGFRFLERSMPDRFDESCRFTPHRCVILKHTIEAFKGSVGDERRAVDRARSIRYFLDRDVRMIDVDIRHDDRGTSVPRKPLLFILARKLHLLFRARHFVRVERGQTQNFGIEHIGYAQRRSLQALGSKCRKLRKSLGREASRSECRV